jgi:hypothetical protein
MRRRYLAVLLVLLVMVPSALARDPFAGKWDATISPEGGGKDAKDVLTFKGSMFTSQMLEKKGFKSQQYEEDTRGAGAISATWKCEQKSTKPAEGKAEWTGTVTASDMTGELKVTKADGTTVNYTFKATKQPEK